MNRSGSLFAKEMNQSTTGKIKLFPEVLSSRDCLFSWEGYVHGFSRGHTVLTKEKRILFIPDDIAYCFPQAANFDYSGVFKKEGWKDLEACPRCGAQNLFPPTYDQEEMEEVECIFIEPTGSVQQGFNRFCGFSRFKPFPACQSPTRCGSLSVCKIA